MEEKQKKQRFILTLPVSLHKLIKHESINNERSMNKEIVEALKERYRYDFIMAERELNMSDRGA